MGTLCLFYACCYPPKVASCLSYRKCVFNWLNFYTKTCLDTLISWFFRNHENITGTYVVLCNLNYGILDFPFTGHGNQSPLVPSSTHVLQGPPESAQLYLTWFTVQSPHAEHTWWEGYSDCHGDRSVVTIPISHGSTSDLLSFQSSYWPLHFLSLPALRPCPASCWLHGLPPSVSLLWKNRKYFQVEEHPFFLTPAPRVLPWC